MVSMQPPGTNNEHDNFHREPKDQLTDEQKAKAASFGRSLASFIDDITHALATGIFGALVTWGSLSNWNIHVPFLPVAALIFGGHLLVRHVSAAAGKGWAAGKYESELKNFLNSMSMASPVQTALRSSLSAEDLAKAMGETIDKDQQDKRYM